LTYILAYIFPYVLKYVPVSMLFILYITQDWLFCTNQSQTWTYCTYCLMLQTIRQEVCARDIKFNRQYLTLDQISICSHWSGLLSFGVSTALVKVKRRGPNLRLVKQKQRLLFSW